MAAGDYDSKFEDWKDALSLLVEGIRSDGLRDAKGQQLRGELQGVLLLGKDVLERSAEYARERDALLDELDEGATGGPQKVKVRKR